MMAKYNSLTDSYCMKLSQSNIYQHHKDLFPTQRSTIHHYFIQVSTTHNINKPKAILQKRECLSAFDELNCHSNQLEWESLNNALKNINWAFELSHLPPNNIMNRFYDICINISAKFVLQKKKSLLKKITIIPRARINLMERRSRINKMLVKITSSARKSKLRSELRLQKLYEHTTSYIESKATYGLTLFLMGYFMYVRLMGGVQNCTPYHKIGLRKAINLIFGSMLILTPKI